MTFDLPSHEICAPFAPASLLAEVPLTATDIVVAKNAEDIDRLPAFRCLTSLWINGVSEAAVNVVASLTSLRHLVIWNLRAADLRLVSGLRNLERLAIVHSAKVRSLSGLEALTSLRELITFGSCNFASLEEIGCLSALDTLCLEGGFSKPLRVTSLSPLAGLTQLRRLRLASIRVEDKSLRPLHGLAALRDVFVAKMFPAAELRALAKALPEVQGEYVDEFRTAG